MHRCVFLSLLVFLLIAGCVKQKPKYTQEELAAIPLPQRTNLPECSGGFVLAVSGDTITADEVVLPLVGPFQPLAKESNLQQFQVHARGQVEKEVVSRIVDILLYQQAKKQLGDGVDDALEKAVEAEVRKFIISFGGNYARAEQAIADKGMDWDSFRKHQKRMIITHSYLASQLPKYTAITHTELMDCYNDMKDKVFVTEAVLKFSLIDIQPAKVEITDITLSRRLLARNLAKQLLARLNAGEDFSELAKEYSHGHRAMFGGLWKPVKPESLARPYDILATQAEILEPGYMSGLIETDDHIFIMKLEEKQSENIEPFDKVQKEVEAKIDFDRRKKAVDEVGARLVQQASLANKDKFVAFCVERIYQLAHL